MISKKTLSTLALCGAILSPCATFAATSSTQQSLADFEKSLQTSRQQQAKKARAQKAQKQTESKSPRITLGAEAFYGIACDDVCDGKFFDEKKPIDGIDIYGVNFRLDVEFPSLFGVDWITPEVFGLVGCGYGSDTIFCYDDHTYYREEAEGTSKLNQFSAGVALNFELTENFSISATGRLGYSISKFKFEYECVYGATYKNEETQTVSDSDGGLIYGIGAGVHWTFGKQHKISLGIEYAGSTAQPELDFDDEGVFKMDKQSYVFFNASYRFVF